MRNLPLFLAAGLFIFALGVGFGGYYGRSSHIQSQSQAIDTPAIETGPLEISRKFKAEKSFADFPTSERYSGKAPVHLDYSNCKYGRMYRVMARRAADSGANFAGHFAFKVIECGPSCQLSLIVDLRTGKVYAGPQAGSGYEFFIGSKILVINPPDSQGWYSPCGYCIPEQYLWTGTELRKLQ